MSLLDTLNSHLVSQLLCLHYKFPLDSSWGLPEYLELDHFRSICLYRTHIDPNTRFLFNYSRFRLDKRDSLQCYLAEAMDYKCRRDMA